MNKEILRDIVEWDTVNWSRAIKFLDNENINYNGKHVLELGARNGGLSLYFALKGAYVVCSDLNMPTKKAEILHKKYGVEKRITYEAIDATNLGYINTFDIVCFKSVLGGIGLNNSREKQQQAINQIYSALKVNNQNDAYLLFVENLVASPIHTFFREKFVKRGNSWRYLTINELLEMLQIFQEINYKASGFFGCFGRNNIQRNILGYLDYIIDWLIPKKHKYIGAFVAKK